MSRSNKIGPLRVKASLFHRLHIDDRGNLGVLLLMTVWAMVVLIAMVWNTGEYATRRRHVQTAADSAAHAGHLWVSRTTNLTAATNMVMSENGSAEVILRAVPPTEQTIQKRLDSERTRAGQLLQGNTMGQPEKQFPDCEYFEELIGTGAWKGNGRGDKLGQTLANLTPQVKQAAARVVPLLPGQQGQRLKQQIIDGLRQNNAAMDWLLGQYIGNGGAAPAKPGAAPVGGVGAMVDGWISGAIRPRLNDILQTLVSEQSQIDEFSAQTAPALAAMTPEQLRDARQEMFDYQTQIRDLTPSVVEEQRAALAAFYGCDITFSVPRQTTIGGLPAIVHPPIVPASEIPSVSHTDSIREQYPDATRAHFGDSSPVIDVDPINVNVDHSVIWHPGASVDAPGGITFNEQDFSGTFSIGGGNFGHIPCAPLSRYLNDRVSRDEQGLRKEPQAIDQARSSLGGRIVPVPAAPVIPKLPTQIPDPVASSAMMALPPQGIPSIPTPPGLTPAEVASITALNGQTAKFNSDVRAYVSELRALQSMLQRMNQNVTNLSQQATQVFADNTWTRNVDVARDFVLREIGSDKQFMVLSTYSLQSIPDWATEEMRESVRSHVYQIVYDRNIGNVTRAVRSRLQSWASGVSGGGRGGKSQSDARNFASSYAQQIAQDMVSRAADQVAREVANEWVLRPWPYEILPPKNAVPPTAGISDDERKKYFTFLAAALTTDTTAPRPMLTRAFNLGNKPMAAFAQSETFNWMEFNDSFGAGDAFNQFTAYGHGDEGGSPRPWRLATTGGWNWQPRLALSDALGQAIDDGQQFGDFLNQGGVTSNDDDAIKKFVLH